MSETPEPAIYPLKVLLLGISPMIMRRLLVCSMTTITDFHYILQITMGWSDDHLHMFRIHGKQYGIARIPYIVTLGQTENCGNMASRSSA